LMLGFPSVRMDDPDLYALDLLAAALGGGESAILVEELRDRRQLVSAASVSDDTPSYVPGTFGISLDLDPDKVPEATEAALAILDKVKAEGIDPARVARAKTGIRADRVKRMQAVQEIASSMAEDYLSTGDPHFSDLYVDRIEAVTPAQVQEVAKKYLNRDELLTTALVPTEWSGAKGL